MLRIIYFEKLTKIFFIMVRHFLIICASRKPECVCCFIVLYNIYTVKKPFEVLKSTTAPAFVQIGFGTQYEAPVTVEILLKHGVIE